MSIRLAVFDIDGTLAKTDEPIPAHISERLRRLEDHQLRIVLISGRTASYLADWPEGWSQKNRWWPAKMAVLFLIPTNLWREDLDVIPHKDIEEMKITLLREFPDIWFQPNQTMLTAAPKNLAGIEELYRLVLELQAVKENGYKLNKYDDAVEVMPKANSKGRSLAVIKDELKIKREEVIVFGNTVVDLP
jgi:hydroxymethylpyrimidine pyrophosphatase-like HAD family hydrolase